LEVCITRKIQLVIALTEQEKLMKKVVVVEMH